MCISSIPSLHQHTASIQLHYGMAICFAVPYIEHNSKVVEQPHLRVSYNCLLFFMCFNNPSRLMLYRFSAIITDGIKVMTNYSCLAVNTNVFIWYCLFVSLSAFTNLAFTEIKHSQLQVQKRGYFYSHQSICSSFLVQYKI